MIEVVITGIVAVLGILVAYYFWSHPRRTLAIGYQTATRSYFDTETSLPDGARMSYRGKDIMALSRTVFVVWNHGFDVLKGTDIVESDPLRLEFDDANVIRAQVLASTEGARGVGVVFGADGAPGEPSQSLSAVSGAAGKNLSIRICYDYLSRGHGFVLDATYAGTRQPRLTGTSVGLPGRPKSLGTYRSLLNRSTGVEAAALRAPWIRTLQIILLPTILTSMLAMVALDILPDSEPWALTAKTLAAPVFAASFIVYIQMGFVLPLWLTRRKFPAALRRTVRDI